MSEKFWKVLAAYQADLVNRVNLPPEKVTK